MIIVVGKSQESCLDTSLTNVIDHNIYGGNDTIINIVV